MRPIWLVFPLAALAALAATACSPPPPPPPDPSHIPVAFALGEADFPSDYEFHDDRDLRGLDVAKLDPKAKDVRLTAYSNLVVDWLSTEQPGCAGLLELGRRPAFHTADKPAPPTSAESRSTLGHEQSTMTTLSFTVTRDPVPQDQYRQALGDCEQIAVTSDRFGPGQATITAQEAPAGGLAYDVEAQTTAAQTDAGEGIPFLISRVVLVEPVGRYTVIGVESRPGVPGADQKPLDEPTLHAMFAKLVDKVKAG